MNRRANLPIIVAALAVAVELVYLMVELLIPLPGWRIPEEYVFLVLLFSASVTSAFIPRRVRGKPVNPPAAIPDAKSESN